ncbi:transglycosylase domain-containing protein [Agromyces sp. LHK192]|uniref:transglycosylase domain-containing protein n=1 Tax=Agromyces sp. LHK192 TaxID=2498704 RepID=UPI0013E34527|nr:transglycosylase domain-containing protein [Agromyces sp. LHK192]
MSGVASGLLAFLGLSALTGILVTATVTPAIAVTGMAASSGINLFENIPDYLDINELSEKTDIYATAPDGSQRLLASFFSENREEVPLDRISQFVKDAAVAGEDPRFFEHGGIDIQGTTRAVVNEFVIGGDTQGGSSITQQYVKNVLINNGIREAKTQEEQDAAYEAATESSGNAGITRKLKEMKLAIALEKKYDKNEILKGYLNIAHFGGRVYGIESAAQYYFAKSAADVSPAEAASLIAIVNHPEKFRLDQPDDPENGVASVDEEGVPTPYAANKDRRDYILGEMLKYGKITQADYDAAIATPVAPNIQEPSTGCQTAGSYAYFCDYVKNVILNHYDDPATTDVDEGLKLLQEGGLQVHTTLDMDLQDRAQGTMLENVPWVDDRFDVGSSAVTVQPGTGKILAMTQNKNYSQDQEVLAADRAYSAVNYSTDFAYGGSSGFQPGSTFKVFTLGEWLNEGHSLLESFNGARRAFTSFPGLCDGSTWRGNFNPRNDDSRTANNSVDATKYSVNSSFMAMAQQLQLCGVKNTAQAFGIYRADGLELGQRIAYDDEGVALTNADGSFQADPASTFQPSAVLGTEEVSPLSMAVSFAGIANDGLACTPIAIESITKIDGSPIEAPKSTCTQAVTPEVARAMQYAMKQTFNGGTASASNTGTGIEHIGKTGTTDNAFDTWMVGSSKTAATAVWVGNVTGGDNRTSMREVSFDSGSAATARHRMWPAIMELADEKFGGGDFTDPDASAFKQVLVDIPQVAGLAFDAAKQALEAAGFVVEDGGQQDSNLPAGQVSGTDPSGQAGRGTTIRVFTSNGQGTTVPDLTGMTQQQAKAALDQAGLKMNAGGGGQNAVVTAQNPAAGTASKRGETVSVQFGVPSTGSPGDGDGDGDGNGGNGGND